MQVQVDLFASLLTLTVLKVQHDIFDIGKKGGTIPSVQKTVTQCQVKQICQGRGKPRQVCTFEKGGNKGFLSPLCASDADIDPKKRTFLFGTDAVAFPIK